MTVPDGTAAELVDVSTLRHQDVPSLEEVPPEQAGVDFYVLDVTRVDLVSANVRNSQIWNVR
jgi:hypothetical protein